MPTFAQSVPLHDNLIGTRMNPEQDCLHYCMPGVYQVGWWGEGWGGGRGGGFEDGRGEGGAAFHTQTAPACGCTEHVGLPALLHAWSVPGRCKKNAKMVNGDVMPMHPGPQDATGTVGAGLHTAKARVSVQ